MPGLTWRERVVLAMLAHHDGSGGARPSLQRIADLIGKPRWSVAETVKLLWRKNRLRWRRGRHANVYTIGYGEPFEPVPHCQVFPDTENRSHCTFFPDTEDHASLSGKSESHCQEKPDGNRNEPEEPATKQCQGCGLPLPAGCFDCLACGQSHVRMVRCAGCGAALTAEAPRCCICGCDELVGDDKEMTRARRNDA